MERGSIILIILLLIAVFFLIRLISPVQIDDVSPEIPCPEIEKYNPDVLWVIPNFNQTLISKNQTWCQGILSLNKTLGMHGINHSPYREFLYENISQEKLDFAIAEFEKCFGYKPTMFKPPQLKINKENKKLIQENNLDLKLTTNAIFHKVYHCEDTGKLSNKIIKIF